MEKLLIYFTALILPLYLVRFKVGGLPLNILELSGYITFAFVLTQQRKHLVKSLKGIGMFYLLGIALIISGVLISTVLNANHLSGWGILKSWFVAPIIFGWTIWATVKKEGEIRNILKFVYLSGLITALISLGYWITGNLTYDGRLKAFFLSPNHLAMFLTPSMLIGIYFILSSYSSKGLKMFFSISTIIIAIVIWLSQSLAAPISILGAIFLVFLISRDISSRQKLFLILITLFLIYIFIQYNPLEIGRYFNPLNRSSLSSRLVIWQTALKILSDHPWWGIGPANFQNFYLDYQKYFPPYPEWAVPLPHNLFLAFWLQSGILGLVGFLLVILKWLATNWKKLRLTKKNPSLNGLFLAFLFHLLIYGLVDTPYWKNDLSFLFWIFFFLQLKLQAIQQSVRPVDEK